MNSLELY